MTTGSVGTSKYELDTPVLLVDLDKMESNISRMTDTFKEAGVNWRPHIKGVKVPAIAHIELGAGAIGVTCAKLGEAEVMASAGIKDILIANQIVGPVKIKRLVNLLRHADVIATVDSVQNIRELDAAAGEIGVKPRVVVEVNVGTNRCGVDPGKAAVDLSHEVDRSTNLRYVGLMGYEGHTAGRPNGPDKKAAVEEAVGLLTMSARMCGEAGLSVEVVSCGGTGTYWISSWMPGVTEIQAGGGIFSDMFYANAGVKHEFAITVLTTVVSRPTPNRIVVDGGRKTMMIEVAKPKPMDILGVDSLGFSAEHTTINLEEPSESPRIGDKVEFIVGYGDTTVCLHDEMYGIRGGMVETVWPILGRGKLR